MVLPGWLDIADQVKYSVYRLTTEDCKRPERGWYSCTLGKTATTLTTMHMIRLNEMKNLFSAQPSLCPIKQIQRLSQLNKISQSYRRIIDVEENDGSDAQGVLQQCEEDEGAIPTAN